MAGYGVKDGKRSFWIHTVVILLMIVAVIVYQIHPFEVKLSLRKCAMPYFWHIYCPGCGGTRAITALLELRFIKSFLSHPLPLYLLGLLLQVYTMQFYDYFIKHTAIVRKKVHIAEIWAIPVILLSYFAIRNLLMVFYGIDYLGECGAYWG